MLVAVVVNGVELAAPGAADDINRRARDRVVAVVDANLGGTVGAAVVIALPGLIVAAGEQSRTTRCRNHHGRAHHRGSRHR